MTQRGKDAVQKPDNRYLTSHTPTRKWYSASHQLDSPVVPGADHTSCASDPPPTTITLVWWEFELKAARVWVRCICTSALAPEVLPQSDFGR